MAVDDWAIVVAVDRYAHPAFRPLRGPVRDAAAFVEWLTSATGGDVPRDQVFLIASPNSVSPPNLFDATPTTDDVLRPFNRLHSVAQTNNARGEGTRVGRRLYLYLAGHGFRASVDQPALLMADATPERTHHFPGLAWANWFLDAGYFDEIVHLMDCLLEFLVHAPLTLPPYRTLQSLETHPRGRLFSAVAAKASLERHMADGSVRGVFTVALLDGLRGAAAGPDGRVTASSLALYLTRATSSQLADAGMVDPMVSPAPAIEIRPAIDPEFVICEIPRHAIPHSDVRITLKTPATGQDVEILNHRFDVVATIPPTDSLERHVQLPPGLYMAQLAKLNRKQLFEVSPADGVDVEL